MKAIVLLLACAGCSQLFGLEKPVNGTSDASGGDDAFVPDGTPTDADARPPTCTQDNFDDGVIGAEWMVTGTTVSESGGVLHVTPTTNVFIGIKQPVDVTDATVDVDVVKAAGGSSETILSMTFDPQNSAGMAVFGGGIIVQTKNNNATTNGSANYSGNPVVFRIKYDATAQKVTYATKSMGSSAFVTIATHAITTASGTATIGIGSAIVGGTGSEAQFDNFLVTRGNCTP